MTYIDPTLVDTLAKGLSDDFLSLEEDGFDEFLRRRGLSPSRKRTTSRNARRSPRRWTRPSTRSRRSRSRSRARVAARRRATRSRLRSTRATRRMATRRPVRSRPKITPAAFRRVARKTLNPRVGGLLDALLDMQRPRVKPAPARRVPKKAPRRVSVKKVTRRRVVRPVTTRPRSTTPRRPIATRIPNVPLRSEKPKVVNQHPNLAARRVTTKAQQTTRNPNPNAAPIARKPDPVPIGVPHRGIPPSRIRSNAPTSGNKGKQKPGSTPTTTGGNKGVKEVKTKVGNTPTTGVKPPGHTRPGPAERSPQTAETATTHTSKPATQETPAAATSASAATSSGSSLMTWGLLAGAVVLAIVGGRYLLQRKSNPATLVVEP